METKSGHEGLFERGNKESDLSREIKIICEVEKIWIIYDVDCSGELDVDEIMEYLEEMAFPKLNLSLKQAKKIFRHIDTDKSGTINKEEMTDFLTHLMN